MEGVRIPGERAPGGKKRQGTEAGRDRSRESEGGHDADPLAKTSHHGDLHRACDAGDETHADGQRVPSRHRPDGRRAFVRLALVTEPYAPRPVSPDELGFERIVYEKAPPRATITLNRPEVLNAFDFRMLREIGR